MVMRSVLITELTGSSGASTLGKHFVPQIRIRNDTYRLIISVSDH